MSDKKLITAEEFEEKYSIPVETQRKLRSRLKDPLPYIQIESRGVVFYNIEDVDKWVTAYKNKG